MFELNPGLSIWTTVVFILLVVVLGKFAWKPILQSLREREEKIRDSLEQAERARAEAAELLRQNERNMARAEEEFQKIVREARVLGDKMKEEIVTKAHQQAQRELQNTKQEIRRDIEAAKQQLRSEVADLAVKAAEKILDETLDAGRQKKLIESTLKQLTKN
ncbi:MAG: F0F1 ATP synthase subunit B [Ignavibacteriales bacterium]|nr:F0F1 ATP synthase subunit B [Ignavibacteriales bacterium]